MMRVVRPNVTVKASMFIPSLHRRACRFTSLRCRRPCRATRSLLGLVMSESCRETYAGRVAASSPTRPSGRSPTTTPKSSASSTKKPAIIGHSFGGLLVQMVAGRGLAAATVAIDPGPFRGVLPLPFSALKSAAPVIGNPANHARAVPLTYEQFRYGFANAVSEEEAHELYETFAPLTGQAGMQDGVRVDRQAADDLLIRGIAVSFYRSVACASVLSP